MTMIKHNSNCALSCWQFANLNFQYEYKYLQIEIYLSNPISIYDRIMLVAVTREL